MPQTSRLKPVILVVSRELLMTALLLLGISLVVFSIVYLAPGDPFEALLGAQAGAADRQAALQAMELPSTWYGQYLSWLGQLLQGDFGASLRSGAPVAQELIVTGGNTLYLIFGAMLVSLLFAVPIAVYSVNRQDAFSPWLVTMTAYLASALPLFWLGYVLIYIFTHQLGIFPVATGLHTDQPLGLSHLLLPVILLGIGNGAVGEILRHLRLELARVLGEEYVRTARAKGAPVWRHALAEGLILPVTEMVAAKLPHILSGAIIVEQVFNWPGVGRLTWQAALDRDYPVILAVAVVAAAMVRGGSLLHRCVYIWINPRASREH